MKSRRPFVIPLSTRAVELLKRIGPKDAGPVLDSTYLDLITALRDASGDRKATTHGLRTTFATWAERHNVRDSIIEGCLDHIDTNKTRASYRGKSPLEERRAALEAWGLYLVPPVRTERTIRRGDWVSAA
jgi:integrase